MRRPRRTSRQRSIRAVGMALLVLFILINTLAFVQARAATTFVPDGAPLEALLTRPLPEQIGALLMGVRLPRPMNRATPADHYLPYETRRIDLPNGEQLEA